MTNSKSNSEPMKTGETLGARLTRRKAIQFAAGGAAVTVFGGRGRAAAQGGTPATDAPPIKVGFVYVGPVADLGWTAAHDVGRKALAAAVPNVETVFAESIPENPADAERVIRGFAQDGAGVIFTTSFGYMDPTYNVAAEFPDVVFVHISGFKTRENMGTGFGKIEEPRYVSGLIAGKMTKLNKLGYVAAFPIPEVRRGINAFALGVRAANPQATVEVIWTDTWFDPPKELAAAKAVLDAGTDVIAMHQDSAGPMQEAERRGAYGVGYSMDMAPLAPKAVLTSPLWTWGAFYIDTVQQVQAGTWETSQYWGGWKDGVVDMAPISDLVPDDVRQLAEAEIALFKSGEKDIFSVFTGPINDQEGTERVAAGEALTAEQLLGTDHDWFVEGVEGDPRA